MKKVEQILRHKTFGRGASLLGPGMEAHANCVTVASVQGARDAQPLPRKQPAPTGLCGPSPQGKAGSALDAGCQLRLQQKQDCLLQGVPMAGVPSPRGPHGPKPEAQHAARASGHVCLWEHVRFCAKEVRCHPLHPTNIHGDVITIIPLHDM